MHYLATADDFESDLQSEFILQPESGGQYRLRLVSVARLSVSGVSARQSPFSLVFESANQPMLSQRIYRLVPPEGDALDIFIVPIGKQGEVVRYEAIFN
jgi:hypothetical protein